MKRHFVIHVNLANHTCCLSIFQNHMQPLHLKSFTLKFGGLLPLAHLLVFDIMLYSLTNLVDTHGYIL